MPPKRRPVVLLVEDNDDSRDMYEEYLTFHGFRVMTACNGQEAVDAALQARPDLVLMDLGMPVMTGMEAIRIFRSDPLFEGLIIVALTAHALTQEQRAAYDAGFDVVLIKPCLPDKLLQTVEALIPAAS